MQKRGHASDPRHCSSLTGFSQLTELPWYSDTLTYVIVPDRVARCLCFEPDGDDQQLSEEMMLRCACTRLVTFESADASLGAV
jgi:hypothetical protein